MSPTDNHDHDHDADIPSSSSAPLIHHASSLATPTSHSNTHLPPAPNTTSPIFIYLLTLTASISGLLFGYDTGVISSTLVSIHSSLSSRTLTTLDKSLITSSTSFFALLASPVAGWAADRFGRKPVLVASDLGFIVGAAVQGSATTVAGMVAGRSLVGVGVGSASLVTPLYISELAPGGMRGRLVTVSSLFITGGQVVAYLAGWGFSEVEGGWRWMVGLGGVPAALQLVGLWGMPETPRWLAGTGREERAREVLGRVFGGDGDERADGVLRAIKKEIYEEEEARARLASSSDQRGSKVERWIPPALRSLLFYAPHSRALRIACLLQGLQQCCGFNSAMYFSATIFDSLHFSSPTLTSLSVALTNFAFTVVAFHLIDTVGRRRILLLTIPVMMLGLGLCSVAFSFVVPDAQQTHATDNQSRSPAVLILLSLLLYVSSYATGLGVVPWQQSELFPLSVRSLGSSLATATNWGSNTVVGLTFLPMMEALSPTGTFALYSGVCGVGWGLVWWVYPETAGLEIEEVGASFETGWGVEGSVERWKRRRVGRS